MKKERFSLTGSPLVNSSQRGDFRFSPMALAFNTTHKAYPLLSEICQQRLSEVLIPQSVSAVTVSAYPYPGTLVVFLVKITFSIVDLTKQSTELIVWCKALASQLLRLQKVSESSRIINEVQLFHVLTSRAIFLHHRELIPSASSMHLRLNPLHEQSEDLALMSPSGGQIPDLCSSFT